MLLPGRTGNLGDWYSRSDLFVLSSHRDDHSLYHAFTSAMQERWEVDDEGDVNDFNVWVLNFLCCVQGPSTSEILARCCEF